MSRSGFHEGDIYDNASMLAMYRWGNNFEKSVKGKRGQAFLREIVRVLDAMPVKELEADTFEDGQSGCTCVLGEVAKSKGIDLDNSVAQGCGDCEKYDPDCEYCRENGEADGKYLSKLFNISRTMALEVINENDEAGARRSLRQYGPELSPEQKAKADREARHSWMLRWALSRID